MAQVESLRSERRTWLITGVAGFIGSHLAELLLSHGQAVVGLDNFRSGSHETVASLQAMGGPDFRLVQGDILDPAACQAAARGVDVVLHQAALTSVPESIAVPTVYNEINVTGFVNVVEAARHAGVSRFVYASSSAVFGDSDAPAKRVGEEGRLLSPYAASKRANELYAEVWGVAFGMKIVGLRYFNVYGPRQDPNGPYAAVIPTWLLAMLKREAVFLNGDPSIARDFCHVRDVARANVLAALAADTAARRVFNVAGGTEVTLGQLYDALRRAVAAIGAPYAADYVLRERRAGDILKSTADISETRSALGFTPRVPFDEGLIETAAAFKASLG